MKLTALDSISSSITNIFPGQYDARWSSLPPKSTVYLGSQPKLFYAKKVDYLATGIVATAKTTNMNALIAGTYK